LPSASKHVWKLAWPNILSNLLFTTVGFMHIKIVAELGTSSVAAVTTGHRVFFLVQAIFMGLSVASTALVARSWGAQKPEQAEMVAWTTVLLSAALAALISIPVVLIPESIAGLFGLDAETTQLAASFIFYLGIFTVFSTISMMLSTALRATGDVITPLWFLFFSSVLNITFAYLRSWPRSHLPLRLILVARKICPESRKAPLGRPEGRQAIGLYRWSRNIRTSHCATIISSVLRHHRPLRHGGLRRLWHRNITGLLLHRYRLRFWHSNRNHRGATTGSGKS